MDSDASLDLLPARQRHVLSPSSIPSTGLLEGAMLAELLDAQARGGGKARLLMVDYWMFRSYAARINALGSGVQYAGRCLLYER